MPSVTIATVYGWRGDLDEGLAWLNRGIDQRDIYIPENFSDPLLDPLRKDEEHRAQDHHDGKASESAAWLLEPGDLRPLRRCGNPRCVLYFYDTTRNGRRRWCSMAGCGSRAKAAAYYRRTRDRASHTRGIPEC